MNRTIPALLAVSLVVSGCTSTRLAQREPGRLPAPRVASLQSAARYSITAICERRWVLLVTAVDGQNAELYPRLAKIHAVSPGTHVASVAVSRYIKRFGHPEAYSARADLAFEAHPGGRYRIVGAFLDHEAVVWVEDLKTNQEVSPMAKVALESKDYAAAVPHDLGPKFPWATGQTALH